MLWKIQLFLLMEVICYSWKPEFYCKNLYSDDKNNGQIGGSRTSFHMLKFCKCQSVLILCIVINFTKIFFDTDRFLYLEISSGMWTSDLAVPD